MRRSTLVWASLSAAVSLCATAALAVEPAPPASPATASVPESIQVVSGDFAKPPTTGSPGATARRVPDRPAITRGVSVSTPKGVIEEDSLLDELKVLQRVLALGETGARRRATVEGIAHAQWQLASLYEGRARSADMDDIIEEARDTKDAEALAAALALRDGLLDESRRRTDETIEAYRMLVAEFGDAPGGDLVRYELAGHLGAAGHADDAVAEYRKLIMSSPGSALVPDATLAIGEYFFAAGQCESAQVLYADVARHATSELAPYARYKGAWCSYNLGEHDAAIEGFSAVIALGTTKAPGADSDLVREAQGDLVLPYSKTGSARKAVKFFRNLAPGRELELAGRLARVYAEQGELGRSDKLLGKLIKAARKTRGKALDRSHLVLAFQRQLVDNAHLRADVDATRQEVGALVLALTELRATAPRAFMKAEDKKVRTALLSIGTDWFGHYERERSPEARTAVRALYDHYLTAYPEAEDAYPVRFNVALLRMLGAEYEAAAAGFERVIEMRPDGEFADAAAERSVICYLKIVKTGVPAEDPAEGAPAEPLTAGERRFVAATDRWMGVIARNGIREETRENAVKARFIAAEMLFARNHFEDAAPRFASLYESLDVAHELAAASASMAMRGFNLLGQLDKVGAIARAVEEQPRLMEDPELAADVGKVMQELEFRACGALVTRPEGSDESFRHPPGVHLSAAECYVALQDSRPKAARAPLSLYQAGLNFFEAARVESSLKVQGLLIETYPEDPTAADALFGIAEIYRQTTVYADAARFYEAFFERYGKHERAREALQLAATFRRMLGQHDEAVDDLTLYMNHFRKSAADKALLPEIHLQTIRIREDQGRPWQVIAAARQHTKAFRKEHPAVRLQVLAARARAWRRLDKSSETLDALQAVVAFFDGLGAEGVAKIAAINSLDAASDIGEARFLLGMRLAQRAKRVSLADPKTIKDDITRKLALLNEAQHEMAAVMDYGHPGWAVAALCTMGRLFDDLSSRVETTPAPPHLPPEAAAEYEALMAIKAAEIREVAITNYRSAVQTARDKSWRNEWSERAARALARLDMTDPGVKEARMAPGFATPNSEAPAFRSL